MSSWSRRPVAQAAIAAAGSAAMAAAIGYSVGSAGAGDDRKQAAARVVVADERAAAAERQAERAELRANAADAVTTRVREEVVAADKRAADALAPRIAELDKRAADLAAREQEVAAAEKTVADNTVPGNGRYIVGEDIAPGTYKSAGGDGCYWARLDGSDEIIDNYIGDGATVLTVRATDAKVQITRCAAFVKQ